MKKYTFTINLLIIICTLFSSKITIAQLGFCNGNSGDPIFAENFGTGTINSTLPAGTTTYNYSNGFPDDGFYSVMDGTIGNSFGWHQVPDHTVGDTNGKALVVNASFSAGEFYRTTVSGLCENTTYEFSAWLMNLVIAGGYCSTQPSGTIPINVTFEITDLSGMPITDLFGNPITGVTGDITETATPNWQQFGLVFKTNPGETSVILKMKNNGDGGCGNDLAIDDIEFKSCGDFISISDTANLDAITLCSSQTPYVTILMVTPDNFVFNTYFYQWETSPDGITWTDIVGETSQSITLTGVTASGFYRTKVAESAVNLNNTSCNVTSEIYEVIINQLPTQPTGLECWETATINNATCSWNITGIQPTQPTGLECWETATFNNTTCVWDITGIQPVQPTLECWETTTFNNTTCVWDIIGTQPPQPTTGLDCWETATFNNTTCAWEITGTQTTQPIGLECWETATFNTTTCLWEISGDQPIDTTEETLVFCENDNLILQAVSSITNPTYLWSTAETTALVTVDQPGVYTVEITDGCLTTNSTFNVEEVESPVINAIVSDGSSIIVTISNVGNFEYSLDGITFQSSNVFVDVDSGYYTIYIKHQDCDVIVTSNFIHFYIPKYFTPNQDTINDTFDINALEYFKSSEVYIFNRFGKLLKSIINGPVSWDGTHNGNPLPTSDYWYVVIINGQRRVGHFTLKR